MNMRTRLAAVLIAVVMLMGVPWAAASAAPSSTHASRITLGSLGLCIPWGASRICI